MLLPERSKNFVKRSLYAKQLQPVRIVLKKLWKILIRNRSLIVTRSKKIPRKTKFVISKI